MIYYQWTTAMDTKQLTQGLEGPITFTEAVKDTKHLEQSQESPSSSNGGLWLKSELNWFTSIVKIHVEVAVFTSAEISFIIVAVGGQKIANS